MSLSLPIINYLITEKITSLNNTLNTNDTFYKNSILNLTNQINTLIAENTKLRNRVELLEIIKNPLPEKKVTPKIESEYVTNNILEKKFNPDDKPPGLICLTRVKTHNSKINTGKADNNNWQVVSRKKFKRNTK